MRSVTIISGETPPAMESQKTMKMSTKKASRSSPGRRNFCTHYNHNANGRDEKKIMWEVKGEKKTSIAITKIPSAPMPASWNGRAGRNGQVREIQGRA